MTGQNNHEWVSAPRGPIARRRRRRQCPAPAPSARAMPARAMPRQHTFHRRALAVLVIARALVAAHNVVVLDCDEAYNYWEPLHYLWRGVGLQTWEHGGAYALRSYAYALAHAGLARAGAGVGRALAWGLGVKWSVGRVAFTTTRVSLATIHAVLEADLCVAVYDTHKLTGTVLMVVLASASGSAMAASALLPSSFAMACATKACAATLRGKHRVACVACVIAVVFGWPFSGVAMVPFGLYSIYGIGFVATLKCVAACATLAMSVSVACDSYMYSMPGSFRIVSSVVNLVRYNLASGGKSELYGVEGAEYYVKNLALNFQLAFALACSAPFAVAVAVATKAFVLRSLARSGKAPKNIKLTTVMEKYRNTWRTLLFVCTPFPLVVAFFTAIPHKEERFLYMIYPFVCLSAAIATAAFAEGALRITRHAFKSRVPTFGVVLGVVLGLFVMVALSVFRTAATLKYYSAPATIYNALPVPSATPDTVAWPWYLANEYMEKGDDMTINVCVGDEWYRFPSSFHFPTTHYRLRFLKTKQVVPLPLQFDTARGGTAYTPVGLNDNNEQHENFFVHPEECVYLVEAAFERGNARAKAMGGEWIDVRSEKFIHARLSPMLSRVFYIPGYSEKHNKYVDYTLKVLAYPRDTFTKTDQDATL